MISAIEWVLSGNKNEFQSVASPTLLTTAAIRLAALRRLCLIGHGGIPPLNDPASSEHHVGKVIWVDLATPDLAGAEHFYGGLFGRTCTFRPLRR